MRVLAVSPWQGIIGPNVVLANMVEAAVSRGHEVSIVANDAGRLSRRLGPGRAVIHDAGLLELTPRGTNPWVMTRHLRRALRVNERIVELSRRIRAEVIYVNSENMLLAPRVGRSAGCAVVVCVHGARFIETGAAGRFYFRLQKRWVSQYAAVSDTVARDVRAIGVEPGKVTSVRNGVDVARFSPGAADPAFLAAWGIGPEDVVVGAVCHLTPRKGVHHLVEAFSQVCRIAPRALCVLVGGTPESDSQDYEQHLRRMVGAAGLSARMRFAGYQENTVPFLRAMHVVVHPSESESFGLVIAEAMSCAKPVVGFRVGAVPEVITHGQTGLVVPAFRTDLLADAIVDLLHDGERRGALGAAAREKVLRLYRADASAAAMVDLLERASEVKP